MVSCDLIGGFFLKVPLPLLQVTTKPLCLIKEGEISTPLRGLLGFRCSFYSFLWCVSDRYVDIYYFIDLVSIVFSI